MDKLHVKGKALEVLQAISFMPILAALLVGAVPLLPVLLPVFGLRWLAARHSPPRLQTR